jgi:superfamily II RNA helicase
MLPFVVLHSQTEGDNPGVNALCLLPERRLLRGYPRIDFIPLEEIQQIYAQKCRLPNSDHPRALAGWFRGQESELSAKQEPLRQTQLSSLGLKAKEELLRQREKLTRMEANFICSVCALKQTCANRLTPLARQTEQAANIGQDNAWFQFIRHLEFLRNEGFVDQSDRLTKDGLWASGLRLNQPVLIAESIRRQALPAGNPAMLAALLALFVDNRETRDNGPPPAYIEPRLVRAVEKVRAALAPLLERLAYFGFDIPPMPLNTARAIYAWLQMADLETVSQIHGGGEGDVAQLIYRVADNLRQLAGLSATHPRLAASSLAAVELLLRPPVLLPV